MILEKNNITTPRSVNGTLRHLAEYGPTPVKFVRTSHKIQIAPTCMGSVRQHWLSKVE